MLKYIHLMLYKMIYATGGAGLLSLLLTAMAGFFEWGFNVHRGLAGVTLLFSLTHGGLVLYKHIKYSARATVKPAGGIKA